MMMMMMMMMIGTMIPAGVRIVEELWFNFQKIKDFRLKKKKCPLLNPVSKALD